MRSGALAGILMTLVSSQAFANLPNSSITNMSVPVYGIYVTDDPTCMTGLVETMKLNATPRSVNFANSPSLGTGKVPSGGIQCVVFVVSQAWTITWAPGTYTGTTQFGSSTFNDSNCNAGGTETFPATGSPFGCEPGLRPTAISWPDQIKADMAAAGLSYQTDCQGTNAAAVFPMYVSTYSKCRGEVTEDAQIGGTCNWALYTNVTAEGYRANTLWRAPASSGDHQGGIKMDPLDSGARKFKFKIEPSFAVGGNGGSSCGAIGPPKFSFVVQN